MGKRINNSIKDCFCTSARNQAHAEQIAKAQAHTTVTITGIAATAAAKTAPAEEQVARFRRARAGVASS